MPSLVILVSAVFVLSCGQTDRQTESQTLLNTPLMWLWTAWVTMWFLCTVSWGIKLWHYLSGVNKVIRLDACCSAAYTSHTLPSCVLFSIRTGSWLAVWLDMSYWYCSTLCDHPLPALTVGPAVQLAYIPPLQSATPSPHSTHYVSYYSFSIPLRIGGWVGLSTQ